MRNLSTREKILIARRDRGWTQDDLAARSGVTRGSIVNYETGRRKRIPATALKKIAAATGKPLSYFLEDTPLITANQDLPPGVMPTQKIPVITWSQANTYTPDCHASLANMAEHYVYITTKGDHMFALSVRGNSMEPEFREGEYISVDPHAQGQDGDFVVVQDVREREGAFFQLKICECGQILHPLNPQHQDIPLDPKHHTIIGVVTDKNKIYRR